MPCPGTRDEALTSPVANYRDPLVSGVLRPFLNETHATSCVYFETVFAYFAAMIKRTSRVPRGRRLNPCGPGEFASTPAAASKNTLRGSQPCHRMVCSFPSSTHHHSQLPSSWAGLRGGSVWRDKEAAWHRSDRRLAGRQFQLLHNLGPC